MIGNRNRPHMVLTGPALRGCLKCMGQTKHPYPAPMIHESTCATQRKAVWQLPARWRDVITVQ